MTVPPNFTIVTLGVRDLERSIAFYSALGWDKRGDEGQGICWFQTSGSWVGLFGYDALAADIGLVEEGTAAEPASPPAYRGITLAINANTEAAVDAGLAAAVSAGAVLVKSATQTEYGVYSGYFADPDGHLWEVARAPGFPVDQQGRIDIPATSSPQP